MEGTYIIKKSRRLRQVSDTGVGGQILLFLSLFLLLLAFFILLNALSDIDAARLEEVTGHFVAEDKVVVVTPDEDDLALSNFGPFPDASSIISTSHKLWATLIPLADISIFSRGEHMMLDVPYDALFVRGQAILHDDREKLLASTVEVMENFPGNQLFYLDVIFFVDDYLTEQSEDVEITQETTDTIRENKRAWELLPGDLKLSIPEGIGQMPEASRIAIERIITLTSVFETAGFNPERLSFNIRESEPTLPEGTRFYFRLEFLPEPSEETDPSTDNENIPQPATDSPEPETPQGAPQESVQAFNSVQFTLHAIG